MQSNYYRPTRGETIGTWNVFHRDGRAERDVPFSDCPSEVQEMIRDYARRNRSKTMQRPTTISAVDLDLDCKSHGHVFGPIQGSVRHCQRFDCSWRDACDPDDFVTADGDLYDWSDPDRDELGYYGPDAYVLR